MSSYRQELLNSLGINLKEEKMVSMTWMSISLFQKLNEEFIREFKDKLDWTFISRRQLLSDEFIVEFKDLIDWESYFEHNEASFTIMNRFIHKINFSSIANVRISHLTDNQKSTIEKLIVIKNLFINKKTT